MIFIGKQDSYFVEGVCSKWFCNRAFAALKFDQRTSLLFYCKQTKEWSVRTAFTYCPRWPLRIAFLCVLSFKMLGIHRSRFLFVHKQSASLLIGIFFSRPIRWTRYVHKSCSASVLNSRRSVSMFAAILHLLHCGSLPHPQTCNYYLKHFLISGFVCLIHIQWDKSL